MNSKKRNNEENLPTVSKQTAGGIAGAAVGGMLGGPVGAVVGGVAGALVGNSSAKGNKPIKKTVESIRSTLRGRKRAMAVENRTDSSSTRKDIKHGSEKKKVAVMSRKGPGRKAKRAKKRVKKA